MFAHDSGHLCRGKRIHTSQYGNLEITHITSAEVIWEAEEQCSVKNCMGSRVVFYNVTTDPAFTLL